MLKGHSVIELTDVNTGEVERYEDDNLVTNGIKHYHRFYGLPSIVWKEVFSGIKIFENNIEENPNTVVAPLAANLIGYACNYSDTTNNMRGILNLEQSGILEDDSGIKLTWDFAQNQANGTIRCICITPEVFARNPSRALEQWTTLKCIGIGTKTAIGYDHAKRAVISCENLLKTQNRFHMMLNRVPYIYRGLTDDGTGRQIGEFYIDVSGDFSEYIATGAFIGIYEGFYHFLAIKNITTSSPATTNFTLIKIKKGTYEVVTQDFSFSDSAYPDIYFESTGNTFVFNGFLYINKKNKFYKFNMKDYNLEKVLDLEISSVNFIAVSKDSVSGYDFSMDANDFIKKGSSVYYKSSADSAPRGVLFKIVDNVIFAGKYNSNSDKDRLFLLRAPLILTINNLTTPVTKTADKTMKITYVLKEDYSDSPTQPTS